jgi:hypothetical protein
MRAGGWQFAGNERNLGGGDVVGASVVYEGVHEFTFSLQRVHAGSRPPVVGLMGMRKTRGQEMEWRMGLSLADGKVQFEPNIHEFEPSRAEVLHDVPDVARWPGRQWGIDYDAEAGAPAQCVSMDLSPTVPLTVAVCIDFERRTIGFKLGDGQSVLAPLPVLDTCCSLHRRATHPWDFNPVSARPFVTFADTHVPCQNADQCHGYWCGCHVVSAAEATAVTLLQHRWVKPKVRRQRSRSPDFETTQFDADDFCDREYARASGADLTQSSVLGEHTKSFFSS